MGNERKMIVSLILSYAILIAIAVYQHNYINDQSGTILKLRERIIDLESPAKTDSLMKAYKRSKISDKDTWMLPD